MMNQKSMGLITLAAVLVGLLLGLAIWRAPALSQGLPLGQGPFAARAPVVGVDGAPSRTITVSGTGEVRARPDTAFATLGVDNQAEKADQAQQENATRMAAVVEAIKKLSIPEADIQTSALDLQPIVESPRTPGGGQGRIVGYRAVSRVTVRVRDISKVGPVLDETVRAGANVAGNIRFAIGDDAELRQQALKNASKDARTKADAIAAGLGVTISGVHSAAESSVFTTVMQDEIRAAVSAAPAPIPVEPGEMTVTAQLRVVYTY